MLAAVCLYDPLAHVPARHFDHKADTVEYLGDNIEQNYVLIIIFTSNFL